MTNKIADEWQAALLTRAEALDCGLPLGTPLVGAGVIERIHELATVSGDAASLVETPTRAQV
jgi:hypothetical protein